MTLLEQMLHSPRLPQYMRELKGILDAERPKRRKFFDGLREDQKAEFINGEVVVHSPVKVEHEQASSRLYKLLSDYVEIHSLGYVGHEKLLVCLTRNDYEPDICFFDSAKTANIKRGQTRFGAPDLIVEVLSPSTEQIDRGVKFEDYAAHGVEEYWIVDPRKRVIEQYLLEGDVYAAVFKGSAGKVKSRAIEGMEIPVRAAFESREYLRTLRQMLA
jgi:Uma2 family endonuclease